MNRKRLNDLRERFLALSPRRRAVVVTLVVTVFFSFFMLLFIESGHEHDGDHAVSEDGTIWTCSMHPQIRQPAPGNCPICGMALIPAATDAFDDAAGPVQLVVSERAAALMDVRVWPAERRDLERDVRLFGRLAYDETRLNDVTLRVDGQIERLNVAFENAPIRAGAPVAEIYSPAAEAASRELIEAIRIGDDRLVSAARQQLSTLGLTDSQIERVASTGQPARTFTVTSPASGVVTEIEARTGDWVAAGQRILRIAGVNQVWVELEAYETDLPALSIGQRVFFETDAIPGRTYEGRIAFIDPALGAERRTVRVRVDASNPDGRLRPGMFIRARVAGTASSGAPVVIPASAPLITGRRALVYVRVPHADRPTFEPRDVRLGQRSRDHVEVLEGLEEGELVVVNGAFRIDSELQIRGRPSMMAPELAPDASQLPQTPEPIAHLDGTLDNAGPLIDHYLAFTEALAADDAGIARQAVTSMRAALRSVTASDGAREQFESVRARLDDRLARAEASGELAGARAQLSDITTSIQTIAQHSDAGRRRNLRVAVCPMTEDGGSGIWLTERAEIRNPYFGSEMLTCGDIQGTL